jgi:predicted Zn-dependent protease
VIPRTRRLLAALLVASMALTPAACSRVVNPATGESQYTTLSPEDERQIGAQQHPQILQEFGGAYDDAALQAYVEEVGGRLGAVSDLPEDDFTFTILNSEVVNAFALPGGYVYVSRGLLALAENEAELAGVLGHEIGHVTARHAAQRQTQATGAGILATLGTIGAAILGGQVAGEIAQQVAGAGAEAYVAGYSRDQELEADTLGIRYMARAGYDPQAMATFLRKLDGQAELERRLRGEAGDAGQSWFATHPRTLDRVQRAIEEVGAPAEHGRLERDAYLAQIDGLIYGEDPSEGFVRGHSFVHPDLDFAFEAPEGFRLQNTPSAVLGRDSRGRIMIFSGANLEGDSLESYVADRGLRQVAGILKARVSQPSNVRSFTVRGMPAASSSAIIATPQTRAALGLAAVQAKDRAYQFIFISPDGMDAAQGAAYQSAVESFRRLSPDEAAAATPLRIRIVRLDQDAGVERLGQRMEVDAAPVELFEILNAGAVAQGLPSGEEVKLVTR